MEQMKYHNTKTFINGIKFDSKLEAKRYTELKLLEKQGLIKDLTIQPSYELIPSFKKNNKTYRKTQYIADFSYYDIDLDKTIVEDTKGFKTDVYLLKKKLFEYNYPNLTIREVTRQLFNIDQALLVKVFFSCTISLGYSPVLKSMYQNIKLTHNITIKIVCSCCVVNILTITKLYDNIINRKRDDYIMASLTSAINVNVDTKVKDEATTILKDLGLNMSTFINMALAQVVKRNGVPFEVVNPTPSKELLEAFAEIEDYKNGKVELESYEDVKALRKALINDQRKMYFSFIQ